MIEAETPSKIHSDLFSVSDLVSWLGLLCGFVFSLFIVLNSSGAYLDDEIGHYIISLYSWTNPPLIFSDWGRTGTTVFFMLPAVISGLTGTRVFALLSLVVSAWLLTKLARQLGFRFFYLVPVMFFFQLWIPKWGSTCLTQTPLLFFWVVGAYLLYKKHFLWAALSYGCLPLIRHETILLLPLVFLFCCFYKRWMSAFAVALPLVGTNIISYLWLGHLPLAAYLSPHRTDFYGRGRWNHFLTPLGDEVGIVIILLAVIGLLFSLRRISILVFLAPYLVYLSTHTIIYYFGLYASGGYTIFLLPVAPMFALLAVAGLDVLSGAVRKPRLGLLLAVAVCVPVVINGSKARPQAMKGE